MDFRFFNQFTKLRVSLNLIICINPLFFAGIKQLFIICDDSIWFGHEIFIVYRNADIVNMFTRTPSDQNQIDKEGRGS